MNHTAPNLFLFCETRETSNDYKSQHVFSILLACHFFTLATILFHVEVNVCSAQLTFEEDFELLIKISNFRFRRFESFQCEMKMGEKKRPQNYLNSIGMPEIIDSGKRPLRLKWSTTKFVFCLSGRETHRMRTILDGSIAYCHAKYVEEKEKKNTQRRKGKYYNFALHNRCACPSISCIAISAHRRRLTRFLVQILSELQRIAKTVRNGPKFGCVACIQKAIANSFIQSSVGCHEPSAYTCDGHCCCTNGNLFIIIHTLPPKQHFPAFLSTFHHYIISNTFSFAGIVTLYSISGVFGSDTC